jgi:hypothetical protein
MAKGPVLIIDAQIGPGSTGTYPDQIPLTGGSGKPFQGKIGLGQLIYPFPVYYHITLPVGIYLLQRDINIIILGFFIIRRRILLSRKRHKPGKEDSYKY